MPNQSTEQFCQVLRNSWRTLANSQAPSLTAKSLSNIVTWEVHNSNIKGKISVLDAAVFGDDRGGMGVVVNLM